MIMHFLSLVQTVFIPGYIFCRLIFTNLIFKESIHYIVALSLILNWTLGFYLVLFDLFTKDIICILIFFEILMILYLNRSFSRKKIEKVNLEAKNKYSFYKLISFIVTIIQFLIVLIEYDGVLDGGDALISWNYWALSWSANQIPHAYHYPQLLPVNFAYTYVLTGSELQFVPSIVSLILMPLSNYALYITGEKLKSNYLHATNFALFLGYMIFLFYGTFGRYPIGLVDLPLAAMGIIGICAFITSIKDNAIISGQTDKMIATASIIISGLSAIKQIGLFLIVFYIPCVFYFLYSKNKSNFLIFKNITITILIFFLVAGYWYIHNILNTSTEDSASYFKMIQELYSNNDVIDRFLMALNNYYLFFVMYVTSLLCLFIKCNKYIKYITIANTINLFVWAIFLSYDYRNIALGLALTSFGIGAFLMMFERVLPEIEFQFNTKLLITISAFIICMSPLINIKQLAQNQYEKQDLYGSRLLRYQLFVAFNKYGIGKVISSDPYLAHLTEMPKNTLIYFDFRNSDLKNLMVLNESVSNRLAKYIMVSDNELSKEASSILAEMHSREIIILLDQVHDSADTYKKLYLIK